MLDQKAILNVLLKEKNSFFAFAWSIVRDAHKAEDVYQEMTIKALNFTDGFNNDIHLKSWCRTVIRNRCIDDIRKETNRRNILEKSVIDLIEADLDSRDMEKENQTIDDLRDCIGGLTAKSQEIIRMRYFQSMQAKKVAEVLQKKPETVYKALQRIYQSLRTCVENKNIGEKA